MIYFIHKPDANAVKIGHSTDPKKRLAQLQTGHHEPLSLIGIIEGGPLDEAELHHRFSAKRLNGEWFQYDDDLAEVIDSLLNPARETSAATTTEVSPLSDLGIVPLDQHLGSSLLHRVTCPSCGFTCVHPLRPFSAIGWAGRVDLLRIPFHGECGHSWDLCFDFHEGETSVYIQVDGSPSLDGTSHGDCHERLHAEEQDSDVESDDADLPPDEFDAGFR